MSAKHTPGADRLRLQALWDANRDLLSMRGRLAACGCRATVAKVEAALRSVSAAYAATNKRIDAAVTKAARCAE